MSEFFVSLSSIEDVRQFVNAATCCPCEVDVLSGRYVIDGSDADRSAFEQSVAAFEVKQTQ